MIIYYKYQRLIRLLNRQKLLYLKLERKKITKLVHVKKKGFKDIYVIKTLGK